MWMGEMPSGTAQPSRLNFQPSAKPDSTGVPSMTTATTTAPALSDAQVAQFNKDGYLILPGVFDAAEIQHMASEADAILDLLVNATLALDIRSHRLDLQLTGGKVNIRKVQPVND